MPADTASQYQASYTKALEGLWDLLSDAIENGRLTESDMPDDYQAMSAKMEACGQHYDALLTADTGTTAQHQARYTEALEGLWDLLSGVVEGGRLTEADIPDDYQALVSQMMTCEARRSALLAH